MPRRHRGGQVNVRRVQLVGLAVIAAAWAVGVLVGLAVARAAAVC